MDEFDGGGICKLPVHHPGNSFIIDQNVFWSEIVTPKWERASLIRYGYPFVSWLLVPNKFSEEISGYKFASAVIFRVNRIIPLTYKV
jgi:hypothetical protein